jgi:hypothetical protein
MEKRSYIMICFDDKEFLHAMIKYVWCVELGLSRGIHLLRSDQEALARSYAELGYKVIDIKEPV